MPRSKAINQQPGRINLMSSQIDLQIAVTDIQLPDQPAFIRWAEATLMAATETRANLSIRIVDTEEITNLNREYRQLDKATNVLSFPFDPLPGIDMQFLGDIAICARVVIAEATDQDKPLEAHWAHIVVHGILHLCGYDHIEQKDSVEMEILEVNILSALGFKNPY